MNLSQRNVSLAALGVLSALLFVAPSLGTVAACTCSSINFSPTTTLTSPAIISTNPTVFSGNTVNLETGSFGGGNDWVYVSITGITAGWTVTVTSTDTVTTLSATQIIVGPFSASSSSFPYTITVTAPSTPNTAGHFTINAQPSNSATKYNAVGTPCAPLTVYLKTSPNFLPPPGVPQFPYGMALLMALAIPALLLVKNKRFAIR